MIPQTTAKRLLISFLALSSHSCVANWSNSAIKKISRYRENTWEKGHIDPKCQKKYFWLETFLGAIFGLLYHVIKKFLKNSSKKLIGHALEKCLILTYNKRIIKVRSVN